MKREESVHFHKPTSQVLYLSLFSIILAILVLFSYVVYLVYNFTIGTQFDIFSKIMLGLIIVVVAVLVILLILGKAGLSKELSHFKKYKLSG